ncbi:hypothetical protein JCM8547_003163 [Rhodosporidiobolus lusitaniae]
MATTLQELATYAATKTAVLPGLLAFSMGSRQSLKSFLAATALKDVEVPQADEGLAKRFKRARAIAGFVTLFAVLGLEFWLISQQDTKGLDVFLRVVFAVLYQCAFMGTLVDVTKAFSWAAFRSPGRMLHFRPAKHTVSFPRVLTSVVLATGLNLGAYFQVNEAIGSILVGALLYRATSGTHRRSFSIRVVALAMLAWLALTFVLSGALVYYLVQRYKEAPNGDLVDDEGNTIIPAHPDDAAFASPSVMSYINLFYPVIYAFVPGMLIAGCYRLDYANHVAENPAAASTVSLETVEPRSRCAARFMSKGVVFPSTAPENFYKPYYATALRAWLLAQLVTFGMFYCALPLDEDILKTSSFSLLSLSLAIPFMIVGLAITATVRGEFRRLWTYREEWTVKEEDEQKEGQIALGEENALPEYEAAPLARVAADEKAPLLSEVVVVEEAAPAYNVKN